MQIVRWKFESSNNKFTREPTTLCPASTKISAIRPIKLTWLWPIRGENTNILDEYAVISSDKTKAKWRNIAEDAV